jgi:DNA helicase-2/ATP-dependent DNA helicase PcrA
VNTPKRGLGDKAQQTIQRLARGNGVSLVEGARKLAVETGALGGKGAKELRRLIGGIARWRAMMAGAVAAPSDDLIEGMGAGDRLSHIELAEVILDESGYTEHWQNDKTPEAPGRLENLKELVKALEEFENLQGFLEHVSLIMDNEQEDGERRSR